MTEHEVRTVIRLCGGTHDLSPTRLSHVLLREYREKVTAQEELRRVRQTRAEADALSKRRVARAVRSVEQERARFERLYRLALQRNVILNRKVKRGAA